MFGLHYFPLIFSCVCALWVFLVIFGLHDHNVGVFWRLPAAIRRRPADRPTPWRRGEGGGDGLQLLHTHSRPPLAPLRERRPPKKQPRGGVQDARRAAPGTASRWLRVIGGGQRGAAPAGSFTSTPLPLTASPTPCSRGPPAPPSPECVAPHSRACRSRSSRSEAAVGTSNNIIPRYPLPSRAPLPVLFVASISPMSDSL
jgi:hypothetical protein